MRVLMFCPQFAPLVGGAEIQAERLGKALVAHGADVQVWTPRLDAESLAEEVRDGLAVRRFPLSDLAKAYPGLRGIGVINAPWISLQIACRVWREIGRSDIVHCHIGCLQSISAACAARLRGVPVICKAALADDLSDLGEMTRSGFMGRLAAKLGKHIFVRWVATTSAVREALQRAGVKGTAIVVIPNGAVLSPECERWVSRPVRRFLYLGRLPKVTERDVPGLIRAFDALAAQVIDVELAIVGGGEQLEQTRRLAAACTYADRILVPGHGNAQHWLAWADCFVLPSRREGLSNALLEAMAVGLPCIASDIPPNREVLAGGAAGLLVPVGDVESLRTAMQRLVQEPATADQLARAAFDRVKSCYSMTEVRARYMSLYGLLIGGRERST